MWRKWKEEITGEREPKKRSGLLTGWGGGGIKMQWSQRFHIDEKKSNISDHGRRETFGPQGSRAFFLQQLRVTPLSFEFNSCPILSLISAPRSLDPLSINASHCFFPSHTPPLFSVTLLCLMKMEGGHLRLISKPKQTNNQALRTQCSFRVPSMNVHACTHARTQANTLQCAIEARKWALHL